MSPSDLGEIAKPPEMIIEEQPKQSAEEGSTSFGRRPFGTIHEESADYLVKEQVVSRDCK